jgi:hypothetical protein
MEQQSLPPPVWQPNLICVIENGAWDAAAYAYSEAEFNYFLNDKSGRSKIWLTHPKAEELAK